ncbi:Hypothetical predicted protein, partial [Marmota monax]
RSQSSTADSDLQEDGIPSWKSGGSAEGGKGIAPVSPMRGNTSNPNKADIPEPKKSPAVPSSSTASGGMTPRRSTTADRRSAIQNGKENSTIPDQTTPVAQPTGLAVVATLGRIHLLRDTFHRPAERRTATSNGPPASRSLSHEATPLSQTRSTGSTNRF